MRIVILGADGFIGRNLRLALTELSRHDIVPVTRDTAAEGLLDALTKADVVFHLAGVNRPQDPSEFQRGNADFTAHLAQEVQRVAPLARIVFASSIQAELDNPYGRSKLAAEATLRQHARETGAPLFVFRLPNVFGKWSRPNYNSAVATFCHRVALGLPIDVHDPAAPLRLVYIDDVVQAMLACLDAPAPSEGSFASVQPVHESTVGTVADLVRGFAASRETLVTDRVGIGLVRALYATYVSHLPIDRFHYRVPVHADPRGEFVEMLKTPDCGQFSYFTAGPGVTRGEHYHHTKTEKFLVIRGTARFGFRHVDTGEMHSLDVAGGEARIVDTVPGWTHNITNIGTDELIVMLWANEIFDRQLPDTMPMKVQAA